MVGGFIGTVSLNGNEYNTADPLSTGSIWNAVESVSTSDYETPLGSVDDANLTYTARGDGEWNDFAGDFVDELIGDDAMWVWNDKLLMKLHFYSIS